MYFKQVIEAWKEALKDSKFKAHAVGCFVLFYITCQINFYFLNVWQERSGILLNDRVLKLFSPHDFSVPIFLIVYGSVFAAIIYTLRTPKKFVVGFYGYSLVILVRTVCIYLLPLEPPADLVFLADPITNFFLFKQSPVTKDLFFSGHTSTVFYFTFVMDEKWIQQIGYVCACILGMLLLFQHVHYTIDIFAAPFFAYLCYVFSIKYIKV